MMSYVKFSEYFSIGITDVAYAAAELVYDVDVTVLVL